MKRLFLLFVILVSISMIGSAQNKTPDTFLFDGYVLSTDSIPLEGAFLINYRTQKIVATDHTGYFKTTAEAGDSLMVNHVSMSPKVVKAVPTYIRKANIFIDYRTYIINPITSYDEEKQRSNLEQSMEQLNEDIKEQIIIDPTKRTGNDNTYDTDVQNPGATIIRVTPNLSKKEKKD